MTLLTVSMVLLWLIVLLNLLLTLALIRRIGQPAQAQTTGLMGLSAGDKAPDFTAHTPEGRPVTLANFLGRPTAFLFISPTCSACLTSLSDYVEAYALARQADANLTLVVSATPKETGDFLAQHGLSLPAVAAPYHDNPFMQTYKSSGFPTYCYLDERGIVVHAGLLGSEWQALVKSWRATVVQTEEVMLQPA